MSLAYAAVLATICCTACSQLLQKAIATRQTTAIDARFHDYLRQPLFWLALAALGIGMLFWLVALSGLEVSKAYSLLSANYVLVPLLAQRWFGERLTLQQWCGIGTLVAGLLLVSLS